MMEEIVRKNVEIVISRNLSIIGLVIEVGEGWIKVRGKEFLEKEEHDIIIPVHSIKFIKLLKRDNG
jgi:hypothetical protein